MMLKNNIINQKKKLRKLVKELKSNFSSISMEEESKMIFRMVEDCIEFKKAKSVLAYWSLKDEVSTHDFITKWYKTKQIILPLVVGDELELRVFSGLECMEEGPAFGILEPKHGANANPATIDFAIIPGIAFDHYGNRLGRGKAYYDKLLKNNKFYKAGVCFSFQIFPIVPVDKYDIPMDIVISPH